jgi:hypothetical protein
MVGNGPIRVHRRLAKMAIRNGLPLWGRVQSENQSHELGICTGPNFAEHETRSGNPRQSSTMANGRCRMHGGPSPAHQKGNRKAFKHGPFTAEAIARRREASALIHLPAPRKTAPGRRVFIVARLHAVLASAAGSGETTPCTARLDLNCCCAWTFRP